MSLTTNKNTARKNIAIVSLLFLIVFFAFYSHAATVIRIQGPRADIDPVNDYFEKLTSLILSKTDSNTQTTQIKLINSMNLTQGRILRRLENDHLDLIWTGTNIEREQRFLPIRIPLFKGLLGYRVALIRQDELAKFKNVTTPATLKHLLACQGAHWPDSDILEENGYKVSRVVHYDAMFKMLARKRCDYYPRGIFEAYAEQQALKTRFPELMVMDDFILHYPFPIYYFVQRANKKLAQRLRQGLLIAQQDGSWLQLLKQHQVSKHLFPISQWQNRQFFELSNHKLPNKTPVTNKALWLDLESGG